MQFYEPSRVFLTILWQWFCLNEIKSLITTREFRNQKRNVSKHIFGNAGHKNEKPKFNFDCCEVVLLIVHIACCPFRLNVIKSSSSALGLSIRSCDQQLLGKFSDFDQLF